MSSLRAAIVCSALALPPSGAWAGCGDRTAACRIDGDGLSGGYHLVLPQGPAPATGWPAVMFLHGWGGDGRGVLRNDAMLQALTARGYALIAPEGSPRRGRNGRSWRFRPITDGGGRDDAAFLRRVADDASQRHGLDRRRMILAGFSLGGSMVSYMACDAPGDFTAYAPVSGSFWEPAPKSCAGSVRLFHTHGWRDGTVPLEGRAVGGGAAVQGDVFEAMQVWRAANACSRTQPDGHGRDGDLLTRRWQESCAPGTSLVFGLHPGGHAVPPGWADTMLDWAEGLDWAEAAAGPDLSAP